MDTHQIVECQGFTSSQEGTRGMGGQLVERSILTFLCTVGGNEEKSWQSSRLKLSKGDIFVRGREKFLGRRQAGYLRATPKVV